VNVDSGKPSRSTVMLPMGMRAKASGGLRPRMDTGEPRQGDDVEQGGLDVAAPVIGEKQVRAAVVLGQISLRKKL
jgi:hypothetical protein